MIRVAAKPKKKANPNPQNEGSPGGQPGTRIRVLLAEDHPVVRKGIAAFLAQEPGLQVLDEAKDGKEALSKTRELTPDVVLMDIDMPQLNGLDATEILRKELPSVKVLVLSGHKGSQYVMRILQSGARGYIQKDASAQELLQAVMAVARGDTYFGPEVARLALNQLVRSGNGSEGPSLTAREREILVMIAEGLYNKEIAARLNISTRTVETHRERIMRKLDIHSTAGLTKYAVANGLITLPQGL